MAYPQLSLRPPFSWLSPPSLGKTLLLLAYWAIITYMSVNTAIVSGWMHYEMPGFRSGWISLAQVPLIYILSSKANVVAFLCGSSYERINWFHRWVSRTLLVTVTVHGSLFIREWIITGPGLFYLKFQLGLLPMVKWGLAAWAGLVWTFLSSLAPLRRVAYEFFVFQHIIFSAIFLWLLWNHVPV